MSYSPYRNNCISRNRKSIQKSSLHREFQAQTELMLSTLNEFRFSFLILTSCSFLLEAESTAKTKPPQKKTDKTSKLNTFFISIQCKELLNRNSRITAHKNYRKGLMSIRCYLSTLIILPKNLGCQQIPRLSFLTS